MAEFNDRISAQRSILKIVNLKPNGEELFGLTESAIERWVKNNNICDSLLITLLYEAGEKLFFLANKSQEQITNEYINLVDDFHIIAKRLSDHLTGDAI